MEDDAIREWLQDWWPYCTATSTATAAVFAVFFLAFQVNSRWRDGRDEAERHWATATLYELSVPAIVTLTALIPNPGVWTTLSMMIGLIGLILTGRGIDVQGRPKKTQRRHFKPANWGEKAPAEWNRDIGTPFHIFVYGVFFLAALTATYGWIQGHFGNFEKGVWVIFGTSLWLLISGVYQSWRQLARHRIESDQQDVDPDSQNGLAEGMKCQYVESRRGDTRPTIFGLLAVAVLVSLLIGRSRR